MDKSATTKMHKVAFVEWERLREEVEEAGS
jgi:hypothetical protein